MGKIRLIKVEKNITKNKAYSYLAYFEIDLNGSDTEPLVIGFNSPLVFKDYNSEDTETQQKAIDFLMYRAEQALKEDKNSNLF